MGFRDDQRGQSMQVGAMLLFGMLVVSMATYQVTVVPQQNAGVEFNHNQQVHDQLLEGRNAILRTAATGSGQPVTVDLGTEFPSRTMFINPPAASGTLQTTDRREVTISNAEASGEAGDFWNGENISFETRSLTYTPDYSEYQNPPTTVYENSVLYDSFDGTPVLKTGQNLVDGKRLSLVALDGELSTSASSSAVLDVRPASAATRTVPVTGENDDSIFITIPTSLSVSEWEELLADETHVLGVTSEAAGTVRIELDGAVTYELRTSKVHLGGGADEESAEYVTAVGSTNKVAGIGDPTTLTVEVRDKYNAPKSGVEVTFSTTNGFGVFGNNSETRSVTTDEDGRAVVVFTKIEPSGAVDASIDGATNDGDDPKTVEFSFKRLSGDDDGINPTGGLVLIDANSTDNAVNMKFENRGSSDLVVERARVNSYWVSKPGGSNIPDTASIDSVSLSVTGEYEDVSIGFDKGETETVPIAFKQGDSTYEPPANSNGFFMITLRFDDGTMSTYLVMHQGK